MSDLVERLQDRMRSSYRDECEAADLIEAQQQRIADLNGSISYAIDRELELKQRIATLEGALRDRIAGIDGLIEWIGISDLSSKDELEKSILAIAKEEQKRARAALNTKED